MSIRSLQIIVADFPLSSPTTGAASNADSTPTGTLIVNGTDNGATVTVTSKGTTGLYKASVTLPSLSVGDLCQIRISATVGGIQAFKYIWGDTKDITFDTNGWVALDDVQYQLITKSILGPYDTFYYVSLLGTNTTSGNAGQVRWPYADPNYAALHVTGKSKVLMGPGTFDLVALNVPSPDWISWSGVGMGVTIIRSQYDELTQGAIFKIGSNSVVHDFTSYGYNAPNGYSQPIGFLAKTSGGQSIPTNWTLMRIEGDSDTGADGLLLQTKNGDQSQCHGRVYDCVFNAQFDAGNVLSNQGLPWDCVMDIQRSTFRAIAGTAGWTVTRGLVASSGTHYVSNSIIIGSSADPNQIQTYGLNVRALNSPTSIVTVNLHNTLVYGFSTAGATAGILIGTTATSNTGGGKVFVSNSAVSSTAGGAINIVPTAGIVASSGDSITSQGESVSSTDAVT